MSPRRDIEESHRQKRDRQAASLRYLAAWVDNHLVMPPTELSVDLRGKATVSWHLPEGPDAFWEGRDRRPAIAGHIIEALGERDWKVTSYGIEYTDEDVHFRIYWEKPSVLLSTRNLLDAIGARP